MIASGMPRDEVMWVVIPIKDLAEAKQRLASVLKPAERRGLFGAMVEDVLAAVAQVSILAGVMIVTCDPAAETLAQKYNARVLKEPQNQGHTAAVALAAQVLTSEGAQGLLQVPGDIPLVTPQEIEQVLKEHPPAPSMSIVPSRDKTGSNCVVCSPPNVMPLQFGDNSFYPHLESARNHGLEPHVVILPGIGLDIDTPDDLKTLLTQPVGNLTGAYLEKNGITL